MGKADNPNKFESGQKSDIFLLLPTRRNESLRQDKLFDKLIVMCAFREMGGPDESWEEEGRGVEGLRWWREGSELILLDEGGNFSLAAGPVDEIFYRLAVCEGERVRKSTVSVARDRTGRR